MIKMVRRGIGRELRIAYALGYGKSQRDLREASFESGGGYGKPTHRALQKAREAESST